MPADDLAKKLGVRQNEADPWFGTLVYKGSEGDVPAKLKLVMRASSSGHGDEGMDNTNPDTITRVKYAFITRVGDEEYVRLDHDHRLEMN
jgi:hypothetical protein